MGEWTKERHHRVQAHLDGTMLCGGALDVEAKDIAAMLIEIERGWAEIERLTAPVDVESEVDRAVEEAMQAEAMSPAAVRAVVRPLVTDRARLAREVGRLNGQLIDMNGERLVFERVARHGADDARGARAEVARLTAELAERTTERDEVRVNLDALAKDVGQALCAATLRPGETLTDQRPHAIVSLVVGLVAERHAFAADLDACGGELQTCRATLDEERRDVDRLGAEVARLTAQMGEIRWAADQLRPFGAPGRIDFDGAGQAIRTVLTAVDEGRSGERTAAPGEAWERAMHVVRAVPIDALVRAGLASDDLAVMFEELEADHEIDSLRQAHERARAVVLSALAAVESQAPAVQPSGALAELHALLAAAPLDLDAQKTSRLRQIAANLTALHIERDAVEAALREQIAALEARGRPALTEAEARTWVHDMFPTPDRWFYDGGRDRLVAALLAASRGDVPPKVRPAPTEPGYVGPDGCGACGNDPGQRHAVLCEGAKAGAPAAPAGVPSIAGPAGLDLASGPPAGYWETGTAVERGFVTRGEAQAECDRANKPLAEMAVVGSGDDATEDAAVPAEARESRSGVAVYLRGSTW